MTGRLLRQQARDDRSWQTLCSCGHSIMLHHELLPTTLKLVDGEIVEIPNPAYRPLEFHCDECDCAVTR